MVPAPTAVNPLASPVLPTAAATYGFSFVAAGTPSGAPACSLAGPASPGSHSAEKISRTFYQPVLVAIGGPVGSCCALTAYHAAAAVGSPTTLKLLVDSSSSGHYIDNAIMPLVFKRFPDYRLLTTPYRITTADDHVLNAVAEVTVPGTIKDSYGRMRRVYLGV